MKNINEFARLILFGTTLEEKLAEVTLAEESSDSSKLASIETPAFPGRPENLLKIGNSPFPSTSALVQATARGQVLHFFANHELLAMELMALVLLKFPEAPAAFRSGLVRTIQEEQSHMRLYIARMQELGVAFGDLPLTDYFWNCLKDMRSPLEFVTQMSLTFEQANLDFSLYYRDEIARHGDVETAAILDRVYREEIGHVKHGLTWFNRWREDSENESEWDAYKRLLPPPLTPRRAKGIKFCAAARREAGFSESYIQELEVNSGSKGRPPVIWHYNPSCDAEIVRGKPGFTPPKKVQNLSEDLEPLLMVLARDADLVWVKKRPRTEWLKQMSDAGFKIPEFIDSNEIRDPKLSGFEPWGWSPDAFERFRSLKDRLVESKEGRTAWNKNLLFQESFQATGLSKFFSKEWGATFLRNWLESHPEAHDVFGGVEIGGIALENVQEALAQTHEWLAKKTGVVLKAPYGTSGNQVKRVSDEKDLEGTLGGWIKNTIASQGSIVIEPLLDKLHDLSIQIEVHSAEITILEAREFITDHLWQYQGTILGRKSWNFSSETHRFFNHALPFWQKFVRDIGSALIDGGYQGPAGLDALIYKTANGKLRLKPLIELNPRWTMGRIALALESHIVPGVRAVWAILRKDSFDQSELERKYPVQFIDGENGKRIKQGVFFTTDPDTAKEVVTALIVGDSLEFFTLFRGMINRSALLID